MATDYKSGVPVMMQLGSFQFGINTAAYQTLQRSQEWRWPSQELFNKPPILQYIGKGSESITIPGVIYPEWKGGTGQVKAMCVLADTGVPLTMIDGLGNVMGLWVIEKIDENQSIFTGEGIARKAEFTIQLRRYPSSDKSAMSRQLLNAGAGNIPTSIAVSTPNITNPADRATGLASSVARAMASMISKSTSALTAQILPDAQGAVMRNLDAAQLLRGIAVQIAAKNSMTSNEITSSMQTLGAQAGNSQMLSNSAMIVLRTMANNTDSAALSAATVCDQTVALCRQAAVESARFS